ncbi:Patatin group M-2 [Lasiodiplodia hormozganensis]|uniref:Patatin group M-2 n=1 Tax=Lasiodiplodia hormozganensis TaxID=869390 RepID=A0AA39XTM0_9PEZI|nr:Patatin group M-2 [Lasiodiplodia hormozganensis]
MAAPLLSSNQTAVGGSEKELCLLSLDGGGVRGLSSLLILKRLMEAIDPVNPPKPCDCFDMIGGTSTGGLIALLLGRLRLTVDECISVYSELSPKIFTHLHHRVNLANGKTQGRFDHQALEDGVKSTLAQYHKEPDTLLKEPESIGCKTFVCATSQQTGGTVVLSSYLNERRGTDMLNVAKIWEAARATSAATTFFEPITINDEGFVDGATGANNPVKFLLSEARDIWGEPDGHLEDNIKCLVSIGTGIPSLTPFGPSLKQVGKALKAIATNTEQEADIFRKEHTKLFQSGKAFRFNVNRGLESIGLEEESKWGAIKAATREYVQSEETHIQIKTCALNLKERECMLFN